MDTKYEGGFFFPVGLMYENSLRKDEWYLKAIVAPFCILIIEHNNSYRIELGISRTFGYRERERERTFQMGPT